jgi:hypothetical protein
MDTCYNKIGTVTAECVDMFCMVLEWCIAFSIGILTDWSLQQRCSVLFDRGIDL